ncbi:MAG: S8 family serine peptidase [Calditrichia bacterium]
MRLIFIMGLCLVLCSIQFVTAADKPVKSKAAIENDRSEPEWLPGVITLKFAHGINLGDEATASGLTDVDALFQQHGVTHLRHLVKESFVRSDIRRNVGIESIYNVYFEPTFDALQFAEALSRSENILYAEPKFLYPLTATPNDALYGQMTQFNHVGAPAAWDIVKAESGNVVVAVVDGGTDWDHADLVANIWNNSDEIAGNGIDDDNNGFVDDVRGWNFANSSNDPTGLSNTPQNAAHGTHVGGTIGATTNNGSGVASLGWNCILMPVNAGSPSTDRSVAFGYDGIAYAAANGADIINCSWGGIGNPSSLSQDVINFAYNNGALVVAASGNDNADTDLTPHFPANYDRVLSVGASFKTSDQRANFSNYGATVDVFAPGVSILSTIPGGGFNGSFSGTSMASPMVASLASLVKTIKPGYSVDQIREQIRVTALNIDGVNPGFAGKLGKGRIDALKAVTDFSLPALRISNVDFVDSGNDGIIDAGESVTMTVTFINYLAASSGATLTLSESDNNITISNGSATLASLNTNETASASFQFSVGSNVPDGYTLRFFVDISSGSYSDRDFIQLSVTPPQFASHNTGAVQASITNEGNIGFVGFAGTAGSGFVHDGNNYLFEGGLLLGTSASSISDCVRGGDGSTQDVDFVPVEGEVLTIVTPGALANEEGSILLEDSPAQQSLGVTILQETLADNLPENEDFVIFKYTIVNNNSGSLNGLYVGLFFDWDINANAADFARYDASRRLSYVGNSASPNRIAATKILTTGTAIGHRSVHNPNEIYDGFSNTEKWSFLNGGVQTQSLDNVDVATMSSQGPFSIQGGESIEVAFAVMGASSVAELQTTADAAQDFYDNPRVGIEEPLPIGSADTYELSQNYPNPFNPTTTISYRLAGAGDVEIDIFNSLGQRVRTLVRSSQTAGSYQVVWNGRDDADNKVSSGVYLYRLKSAGQVLTKKMLLLE